MNGIGRVLMLLSIRVEAEFAEVRTEVFTTTISSLWRSDWGEFTHTVMLMFIFARLARVWYLIIGSFIMIMVI